MLKRFIKRQDVYQSLEQFIVPSSLKQSTVASWLAEIIPNQNHNLHVLDLGCGEGDSVDMFKRVMPSALWHGVDIESSPEVQRRTRRDISFDTFDGINLPYGDNFFDIIYTNQVLEHVRYPDRLLPHVARTLKPGGLFIGGVSYLEPYHSRSIFNFTPYGLSCVIEGAGLKLLEIRPGIDAFSLITRQILGGPRILDFLFNISPLNVVIGLIGAVTMLPPAMTAFVKLQYCGQFCFLATKVAE